MVVSDNAGRPAGNGWVTLQSRYRIGTVPQPFLNRSAGTGVKLSPEAHRQQIAHRRPRYLRKCGNTGCARGLFCDWSQDAAKCDMMLAARLRIADASKSGCTSPVAGPASVFRTQIAGPKLPRALSAFQNSLERRRRGCPAFGRPAGAVGGRRPSAFVRTKFVRTPEARALAGIWPAQE